MKVGIFPMVADLLHVGHLTALKYAKQHCDKLIVALNCDPTVDNPAKHKPVETVYERYVRLMTCKYVDEVIPYIGEKDLLLLLQTTEYDIRFIGEDHLDSDWTGKEYEHKVGKKFVAVPRDHTASSTELKQRMKKYIKDGNI